MAGVDGRVGQKEDSEAEICDGNKMGLGRGTAEREQLAVVRDERLNQF